MMCRLRIEVKPLPTRVCTSIVRLAARDLLRTFSSLKPCCTHSFGLLRRTRVWLTRAQIIQHVAVLASATYVVFQIQTGAEVSLPDPDARYPATMTPVRPAYQ